MWVGNKIRNESLKIQHDKAKRKRKDAMHHLYRPMHLNTEDCHEEQIYDKLKFDI